MNDWTSGSFLFWLVVAILVPAISVRFLLGRNGGHRFFENDGLSKEEIRKLPLEMMKRRLVSNLHGSAATMVGLLVALALYPIGCLIGLPINVLGISDEKLILYTAGMVVLLITLGPALYRKWNQDE